MNSRRRRGRHCVLLLLWEELEWDEMGGNEERLGTRLGREVKKKKSERRREKEREREEMDAADERSRRREKACRKMKEIESKNGMSGY